MKRFKITTDTESPAIAVLSNELSNNFHSTQNNKLNEIFSHYLIILNNIIEESSNLQDESIFLECVRNQYPLYEKIINGAHNAEYPDHNWADFWEIINQYFYPSLDISYEKRKEKAKLKSEKLVKDAEIAELNGKERLAKNIRSRKIRPQNWKKTIKTIQIGSNAMEFTAALNHFISSKSHDLGLDGLEWQWLALCNRGDILIEINEIKTRLNDKRKISSRGVDFKEKRRAADRFNLGILTEGYDYVDKYSRGGYLKTAKHYNGGYICELMKNDSAGDVILREENHHLEDNIIIPTCGIRGVKSESIELIRATFSEIKIRERDDANTIFIINDIKCDENIIFKWILRSIVGLHKHSSIIARLPLILSEINISSLYMISTVFSDCEIASPSTGGSIYLIARDFKKNIGISKEKIILEYISRSGDNSAVSIYTPNNPESVKMYEEFIGKLVDAYSKIFTREAIMLDEILCGIHLMEFMKPPEESFVSKWDKKFSPSNLPEGKELFRKRRISAEINY